MAAWDLYLTNEVDGWLDQLAAEDWGSYAQVVAVIEVLAQLGPNQGRPLADRIKGSQLHI
jgi:hypothetical protein